MNSMKKIWMVELLVITILLVSCAHYVEFKSPDVHQHNSVIPLKATFYLDKTLKDKMYYGRAASAGIANRWDVPVGKVVHEYAIAHLKNSFSGFDEIETPTAKPAYDLLIKVTDINYYMEGQAAHCDLTFAIEGSSGKEVYNKK